MSHTKKKFVIFESVFKMLVYIDDISVSIDSDTISRFVKKIKQYQRYIIDISI